MDENSNLEDLDLDFDLRNLNQQQLMEKVAQLEERNKLLREITAELNVKNELLERKIDESEMLREQIEGAYTNRRRLNRLISYEL